MTVKGLLALIFSTTTAAVDGGSVTCAGGVGSKDAGGDGGVGFGGFNGVGVEGLGVELRWRREARRRREEE